MGDLSPQRRVDSGMMSGVTIFRELLSAPQCLAKAAEMEARAELCSSSDHAADFVDMARCWRLVAAQAARQDATN